MRECHISIDLNKTAKQQALQVIQILSENSKLPIERYDNRDR
jgi:ribosome maturation protein Sdo1